jgi:hypothetical protein
VNGYTGPVRAYLSYCRKAAAELEARGSFLDPKYHPTADGAVKMIPHRGESSEARKIREAFRELTGEGSLPAFSGPTRYGTRRPAATAFPQAATTATR